MLGELFLEGWYFGVSGFEVKEVTKGFECILQEDICVFTFLEPGACFEMRDLGLSFASSVSSLDSFSRSWGGFEEILMVSGYAKGHEVCRIFEMGWSSLGRGDEWAGREGMFFVVGWYRWRDEGGEFGKGWGWYFWGGVGYGW